MKDKKLYWGGLLGDCDICQQPFGDTMYDARTTRGPWGNLCEACFQRFAGHLGQGRGQKYKKQPDGRWLCVEGSR